jgi:hypothetical protein
MCSSSDVNYANTPSMSPPSVVTNPPIVQPGNSLLVRANKGRTLRAFAIHWSRAQNAHFVKGPTASLDTIKFDDDHYRDLRNCARSVSAVDLRSGF